MRKTSCEENWERKKTQIRKTGLEGNWGRSTESEKPVVKKIGRGALNQKRTGCEKIGRRKKLRK